MNSKSDVELALEAHFVGKAKVIYPRKTQEIQPEQRRVGGNLYHKGERGLWDPGPGKAKKIEVLTIPKLLVDLATNVAAKSLGATPEGRTAQLEAFEANTAEFAGQPFREAILQAKTDGALATTLGAYGIGVLTFNGQAWIGLEPRQKAEKPEPSPSLGM
jgi:hypothetical protein